MVKHKLFQSNALMFKRHYVKQSSGLMLGAAGEEGTQPVKYDIKSESLRSSSNTPGQPLQHT